MAAETKGSKRKTVAEDTEVVGDALGPQGAEASTTETGKPTVSETLSNTADEVSSQFKGAADDIKNAALDHTRALYDSAKEQATTFADQRKTDAAQSVADIATSLRETGKSFGDRPNIQSFVGSAADGLDQLAGTIRDKSVAEIYGEVEDLARRAPIAVGAIATLAGFMVARFIKSSAEELSKASTAQREAKKASEPDAPAKT